MLLILLLQWSTLMTVRLLLLLGSIAGHFLDSDERGMELKGLCWGDGSG